MPTGRIPSITFKTGGSSATIPKPVDEATTFFVCFMQMERNDLVLAYFWGIRPPYVDFHGYRVPEDCLEHLEAVYHSHGDFMQRFPLDHSAREHFLKLLGCVMNDIEHNFVDTVSAKRILQWRVAVQELIRVDFDRVFLLEHL